MTESQIGLGPVTVRRKGALGDAGAFRSNGPAVAFRAQPAVTVCSCRRC